MKIVAVRATPVNIPMEVPFSWSVGLYPGTTKVIVEIVTDEGLTGLGEAPSPACAPVINDLLAPRLAGLDALDIEAMERRCLPDVRVDANTGDSTWLRAFGGLEMAVWDLRGKAWNQPLYLLLGGAVRKQIPFTEYFAYRPRRAGVGGECSPSDVVRYCARMREEYGSTWFEGKCPWGASNPIRETVKVVQEIRHALGDDARIRLDANMGFSMGAASQILRAIEPYNLDNFEDPVAGFQEMARLRQHSAIPFSSHIPDLRLAVQERVPDNLVLNMTQLGGISRTLRFVAACEAMGVGFWCYSGDSGLASAAYMHVIAATRCIDQPSQALFRWQADDVIEEGPFRPRDNVVPVPDGVGLGVTLSPTGLKRCHQRFLDEGPYDEFLDPVQAGLYSRLPVV